MKNKSFICFIAVSLLLCSLFLSGCKKDNNDESNNNSANETNNNDADSLKDNYKEMIDTSNEYITMAGLKEGFDYKGCYYNTTDKLIYTLYCQKKQDNIQKYNHILVCIDTTTLKIAKEYTFEYKHYIDTISCIDNVFTFDDGGKQVAISITPDGSIELVDASANDNENKINYSADHSYSYDKESFVYLNYSITDNKVLSDGVIDIYKDYIDDELKSTKYINSNTYIF